MESQLTAIDARVELAHFARLGTEWRSTEYSDNSSRLYWIDGGRGAIQHHGCTFVLKRGSLHLIPARTLFSFSCENHLDQHWVHFTANLSGGLSLFDFVETAYDLHPEDAARIGAMFGRLEHLDRKKGPAVDMERSGLMLQLLSLFIADSDAEKLAGKRLAHLRFKTVLEHIDARLSERIRIGELARLAHMERTYFSRAFSGYLGVSPAHYVMTKRIDRAKQRLWTTDEPLRSIADSLGFSDAFHFSKSFHRVVGMSPRDFRNARSMSPRGSR